MRTLKELAQEAIDIQNASNLSGLIHGWSRAITELRTYYPSAGTDEINRHPINKLWAAKILDLVTYNSGEFEFGEVYRTVKEIAGGK
jgi:uncharacterized protein (DUF2235 family)